MPSVENQGVRIHYEVEGQGCPLVLHHGSFGSLNDWRESGYVEALRPDYRLILLDARGHGASTKPHDPDAYRMELRVSDIVAVLDDLGVATAHFMGWSLGGYVGYGLAKFAPQRFSSLVLGASPPGGTALADHLRTVLGALKRLEADTAARDELVERVPREARTKALIMDTIGVTFGGTC